MCKRVLIAIFSVVLATGIGYAQVPVIQQVAPLTTYSNDTLVITGSGFSGLPANLDVWIGPVKGKIIGSSDFAIEVEVPAHAALSNIEVVNKLSNLSAKSELKFMPSLKTEVFNVSKFDAPVSFTATQELWDLCACDLNTDGKPDIISTKFSRSSSPYLVSQDLMILQNESTPGNLAFTKFDKNNLAVVNLGFGTDNVVCGDLNGDGKPELVVSRGSDPRNSIHILRNTGVGGIGSAISFAAQTSLFLDATHAATRVAIHDLNKDGKPELIVTVSTIDVFYIFMNQSSGGTLSFNPTPLKIDIDPATTNLKTYEAEVQDFDGDGLPDIIVNRFLEGNLYILRNQSAGSVSFAAPVVHTMPEDRDLNRVVSADFNNDGKLDLAFTSSTLVSQVSPVYLNQSTPGTIAFASDASAIKLTTSIGAWGLAAGDMDGDNDPDLITANKDANVLNVFLHNGNFASPGFSTKLDIPTTSSQVWHSRNVKVNDFDGDGKPDIVYTGFNDAMATTSVEILRNAHCHQPEILNTEPLTICNGQTIVLKTAPANDVTFTWEKTAPASGAVGTNSPYYTLAGSAAVAGTYRVTASKGACSLSDEITVAFDGSAAPADPPITANTPLCVGATLSLTTPAVGGATYTWTKPDGQLLTGQNQSFAVTLEDGGIYSLQITAGACKSNVTTKRVDVASLDNFSIASNTINNMVCQGGSVQLSVSKPANHTVQWRKDGADINLATAATYNAATEGTYTVEVTNTTLSCSIETDPVQVAVLQPPVAAYTLDATACTGETVTFASQSTVDNRATVAYAWNFGDATNGNTVTFEKTYATGQIFHTTLTVSYTGITGCTDSDNHSINIFSAVQPIITSTAASLCEDSEATLTVSGTFTSIAWNNTPGATASSTTIAGPGTYTVSTTDTNGCAGSDDITIAAKEPPVITATATPEAVVAGTPSQLLAEGADSYAWSPAENLSDPAIANPLATPTATTTYTVTGTIADGCSGTAEITVTVEALAFPLLFSPNGDGINDEWNIGARDKPDCTLNIFDVRGRRIFEGQGVDWNGTTGGKAVPQGTYYYVFGCPAEKPIAGHVLVIR